MKGESKEPQLILVVDDHYQNAKLIATVLECEGYRTMDAHDGETGLKHILEHKPDLVLLDIMMPRMDGFEVCRRLRQDPETEELPVIMLTALNDCDDKVRGLDAGADAFLSKPIERAELLAHVRTHFRIKGLRDEVVASREELAQQNLKLQALERMRQDLTHMLIHDMKGPLTAIQLKLECLGLTPPRSEEALQEKLSDVISATSRLEMMIRNILDVARLEEAGVQLRIGPYELPDLLESLQRSFGVFERMGARVRLDVPMGLPRCDGDAGMLSRVIENLVVNAVKVSPEGGEVLVKAERREDGFMITVADRGPGVPEHLREKIFDKFAGTDGQDDSGFVNHGLGLTFVRLAVEAHGGRIWVEQREGGGSLFRFTLPARPPADAKTVPAEPLPALQA